MKYEPVVGLEIHVELKTKSKMFCQCSADYFGKSPNSNTCPVCLGMPGALPVPNEEAIKWTILIGKALNCTINSFTKFDRKHYFYPDLAKGYQISQYDEPIAVNGRLNLAGGTGEGDPDSAHARTFGQSTGGDESRGRTRVFRIHRVHLEEDTGKLQHVAGESLVDFNRAGVPLVEIVTEPDFTNSDDVKEFLHELHTIIRYLDVSDADMEKGSMRLEPNISVRTVEMAQKGELPKYKVEVKNINSFNFVKKAIDYEVARHTELLEKGETPAQETRGFVEKDSSTKSQRSKEEAHDYRYFPEPDVPPFHTGKFLELIHLPELPLQKVARYKNDLQVKESDATLLVRDQVLVEYFEACMKEVKENPKEMAQKIVNNILNKKIPTNISPSDFVKKVTEAARPKETDMNKLESVVEQVLSTNQKVVDEIKKGKEGAIMYLVGQVMKEMRGQADAMVVKETLVKKLKR